MKFVSLEMYQGRFSADINPIQVAYVRQAADHCIVVFGAGAHGLHQLQVKGDREEIVSALEKALTAPPEFFLDESEPMVEGRSLPNDPRARMHAEAEAKDEGDGALALSRAPGAVNGTLKGLAEDQEEECEKPPAEAEKPTQGPAPEPAAPVSKGAPKKTA